ncbi:MAG: tRNA (guanosine(37)-N1)-methyltransferase TrmD [Verrucomicrobiales bacterium]
MRLDILTIFPEVCRAPLGESILGRAQRSGAVAVAVHDLRDWATGKHRQVDDVPFGGGQGMVMKPDPFFAAIEQLRTPGAKVVLMTPQGRVFTQAVARAYAADPAAHLILLCGHYEGIDHRVVEALVDDEISIGDYVLTNGAIAACVFADAIIRLLPGVLGDERSAEEESFSEETGGLLEAPHYTRPADFRGMKVPDILLSGHHAKIADWRKMMGRERTAANRPDLLGE